MIELLKEGMPLSDRFFIAIGPAFGLFSKLFPKTFGRPEDIPPHASAMLYEHNWLYRLVFPPFFRRVAMDEAGLKALKEVSQNATVVYVAKAVGQLEYNYFNDLFLSEDLPLAQFTNALKQRRWMKFGELWNTLREEESQISSKGRPFDPIEDESLSEMIANEKSVLITLPGSGLAEDGLFHTGPSKVITALIDAQKKSLKPIAIVPIDFVWSRHPKKDERSVFEILFGEKENPGSLRRMVLFWRYYLKNATASIGTPINLKEFMSSEESLSEKDQALRLRGLLIAALKAQRRTTVGPPIKPRRYVIEEIMNDDALDKNLCKIAAEKGKPADDLRSLALKYTKEIIANVDYTYIELGEKLVAFALGRMYESFSIDKEGLGRVKELAKSGPIVLVPNHKSHVDYLILSYILHKNGMTVPHIAAGLNLEFWPLGHIFRHSGAYFIRRAFRGNPLYRAVLETYLKILLKEGYTQEFFIEGGRSRTGKLSKPRKGMIKMLHTAARDVAITNLKFVPVSITYDRVVEQKSYERELEGASKEEERPSHLLSLTKYLKKKRTRFGSIYVNFGEPVPISEDFEAAGAIDAVANSICREINSNAVATPSAVAAAALLASAKKAVTAEQFEQNAELILDYLKFKGARISARFADVGRTAAYEALSQHADSKLVIKREEALKPLYIIPEQKRVPLSYIKNGIMHFMMTISVTSSILLKKAVCDPFETEKLIPLFDAAKRVLSHEFLFATTKSPRSHIDRALKYLAQRGALDITEDKVRIRADNAWMLRTFADLIRPFAETLKIASCHIENRFDTGMELKPLVFKMMETGKDLLLLEENRFPEAITRTGLESVMNALSSYGIVRVEERLKDNKRKRFVEPLDTKEGLKNLKVDLEALL